MQDSKQCSLVPLHPSRRSSLKASFVWTTRSFRPEVPPYPKASICSRLHLSERLSNKSGRLFVFDKLKDFFPKHRYGKTTAIVRTTWLFSPDAIFDKASRVEDVQRSGRQTPWSRRSGLNIKIACSWSATVRTLGQHHSDAALFRKEFQGNLESQLHSCPSGRLQLPSERRLGKSH